MANIVLASVRRNTRRIFEESILILTQSFASQVKAIGRYLVDNHFIPERYFYF